MKEKHDNTIMSDDYEGYSSVSYAENISFFLLYTYINCVLIGGL